MSAPPYMRLYWGDYHRDTRHLSRSEHGAYFMLLSALWNNGGKLPTDDATLAKHAMCSPREWADMKPTMMAFFKVVRGRLTHKRVTEELSKYADTVRKRKAAGKKGGSSTHGKDTENSQANAKQKPTKPEPEPEPVEGSNDPSLSPGKPVGARGKAKASLLVEGFPDSEAITAAGALIEAAGVRLDAADHAKRFRAYYVSRGRELADWGAAWVGWIEVEIGKAPPAAQPAPTSAAPFVWSGPAGLWADVVAVMGAELAQTYLGTCEVRGDELVARRGVVFDRLKRDVPGPVAKSGLTLVLERKPAAAPHPERREQAA